MEKKQPIIYGFKPEYALNVWSIYISSVLSKP